jgi:hypothetical protein
MPLDGSWAANPSNGICGQVGLLLFLVLLRWSEPRKKKKATSSLKKSDALSLPARWICSGVLLHSASHGGEGVEQRAASRSYDLELCRDSNRSLAIARVKPPRWWQGSGVGVNEIFFFNKRLDLPQANTLHLPPPTHGRSGESDDGPSFFDGSGKDPTVARYSIFSDLLRLLLGAMEAMVGSDIRPSGYTRQLWRKEVTPSSMTSTANGCRLLSKAHRNPTRKPAEDSGQE